MRIPPENRNFGVQSKPTRLGFGVLAERMRQQGPSNVIAWYMLMLSTYPFSLLMQILWVVGEEVGRDRTVQRISAHFTYTKETLVALCTPNL